MMGSDELGLSGRGLVPSHLRTRPLDGLDDVVISGATAEIAGDAPADLFLRRVVVVLEELYATHDHARGAESTVKTMVFLEAVLEWVERSSLGGKSLDGGEAVPIGLNGQHGATFDALAIQQDGAGTAAAGIASDVGTGHVEDLADHVHKQEPGFDFQFMFCAIDGDRYLLGHLYIFSTV
jgi:hypothetical protein